ncbi:MAG: hypothetical protein QM485_03670 [Flavobacteriaceae bacterium]
MILAKRNLSKWKKKSLSHIRTPDKIDDNLKQDLASAGVNCTTDIVVPATNLVVRSGNEIFTRGRY